MLQTCSEPGGWALVWFQVVGRAAGGPDPMELDRRRLLCELLGARGLGRGRP